MRIGIFVELVRLNYVSTVCCWVLNCAWICKRIPVAFTDPVYGKIGFKGLSD